MFNNKRIEDLEQGVDELVRYNIPDRLTQLECDHSDISFETISKRKVSNIYTGTSLLYKRYSKVCKKCGKILKSYLSESHCLTDKLAYQKEKYKEEEEGITLRLKCLKKEQQENKNDNQTRTA